MEKKDFIEKLDCYRKLIEEQNIEMHKALVEAVKCAGGKIETDDECYETLNAIIFDEAADSFVECTIDAVKVVDDDLYIHTEDIYQDYDSNKWYGVMGGLVLINATLYNLCEIIPEYLDND